MDLDKVISNFVDDFCDTVWVKLKKKGIQGVGVTGSYVRGNYSKSRPDVNFAIFTDGETPELFLEIGQILSALNKKYSRFVNLQPDFNPERFNFPWGRNKDKICLHFKIAIFELKDRDLPMPFARPGHNIEGHKLSAKMWHGRNYFEEVKISSSNEEVIKGCCFVLSQWVRSIKLTPLSYDLAKDTDLFFTEALLWGRLAIRQFAWAQGIENGQDYSRSEDRAKIFDQIHNKEKLRKFLVLPKKEKEMANLIFDALVNYDKWKNNKKLANKIYLASAHLTDFFLEESKKVLSSS